MVYEFKPGACIKVNPQAAGEVCERLALDGGLTARRLLDESRIESAPLHKAFEWDDTTAAENYREYQASYIIRSLVVKNETQESPIVRAFININDGQRNYRPINVVVQSEDMRAKMLLSALRELNVFRQKYQTLSDLSPVFDAIDSVAV